MEARPSRISDEALLAAVPAAANLRQLLLALGVAAYGGNYEVVRARLKRLGVDEPRFARRPRDRWPPAPSPQELARVVAAADSCAQAARLLGLPGGSGAERRVKRMIAAAGLDTSHFLGQAAGRGCRSGGRVAEPLDTVLVTGRRLHTSNLRERLLAQGLLVRECAVCLLQEWQGQPVPLELDHVNGDRTDNRLENLRVLCPNCHAQTSTYRGRNIGAPHDRRSDEGTPSAELPRARAERRLEVLLGVPRRVPGTPP